MMFVADNGIMAMNFNENGINSTGSLTKSIRRNNDVTAARKRACDTIVDFAKKKGQPVGVVVNKVLRKSIPELQSFVQARGESPASDPVRLAIQAALLRATEIAVVTKGIDTDEDDALLLIEEAEQQVVDDNTAESANILSPDTSAAVTLLVSRIAERMKQNTGVGSLTSFVDLMKRATNASNFDNISAAYVADNFASNSVVPDVPDNVGTTAPSGSFWDNLFNNIDKIVDGVTKVSGAINTTVGNVNTTSGTIIDRVTDIGGQVGAKSISQYMQENAWIIIGAIVGFILFTVLIVRVSANK